MSIVYEKIEVRLIHLSNSRDTISLMKSAL